jgi:regulator of protease activity HflC (stomatin/prohibitin superfamily)
MTKANHLDARTGGLIAIGVAAIGGLVLLTGTSVVIQAGEVGVISSLGKVNERPLSEGFHFIRPVVDGVQRLDVTRQPLTANAAAATSDLQTLTANIQVEYSLDPERSPAFVREFRSVENFKLILDGIVNESFKSASAQFTAEEALQKRQQLQAKFREKLQERLTQGEYFVIIHSVAIPNLEFSPEYAQAIERKQVAEQNAKAAVYLKQQAQEEADAALIKARGEAEAQRLLAESLRNNGGDLAIQLKQIEVQRDFVNAWKAGGSTLPQILVIGEGNAPPMFLNPANLGNK